MFARGLLTCAVLTAFSAHAEVFDDFNGCRKFFYMGTKPRGIDQNVKTICQVYGQGQPRRGVIIKPMHYYATLYSTEHRIPLYSAYVFDPNCKSDSGRTDIWHVEPQISVGYSDRNMVLETERDLGKLEIDEDRIKRTQAMSSDYTGTGYDCGQLKPSSFSCGDGRRATFTLTNAAPMDPCFNRVHWRKWEKTLRSVLLNQLSSDGGSATVYIVTGTVPNANLRIPQKKSSEEPEENYERVTVPSHIWTAVCYKHHRDDRKSFSFGYMAENQPGDPDINPMSVSDLNVQLSRRYGQLPGTPPTVSIFKDACFGDNNKLDRVKEMFTGKIHMSTAVENTLAAMKRAIGSDSLSFEKKGKVKELTVKLAFDSMYTYYTTAENLKASARSACLITDLRPVVRKSVDDEGLDAVECLLAPERGQQRTAADGTPCPRVLDIITSCTCFYGDNQELKTKYCCSSPCLYQHDIKSYRCKAAMMPVPCSPRYSLVTVTGKRCKDDHPCATYGKDYYWCNTVSGSWDYCSPPLWDSKTKNGKYCRSDHACAKYGSRYMWCYTDNEGNSDKCCTSDDCYSAVNGKTCRSNHKCGYHDGKSYLWCYTDNSNNWDYCCTDCA